MIATSMALLSTGADLEREAAQTESGLVEALSEARVQVESADVQICDSDLLLDTSLFWGDQPTSSIPIGNFSPVYSPVSNASADSGVGGGLTSPCNDTFLTELFGSNCPLFSLPYAPKENHLPDTANLPPSVSSLSAKPMPTQSEDQKSSLVANESFCESQVEKNRKNAEAARQNRLKKKRYVEELEKEHSDVKKENVILKTKCHEFQQRCQRLQSEVEYLKSVIANESTLSSLIQNIPNVPNVKLSSSFTSRKRPLTTPDDGASASKRSRPPKKTTSGGVCLHVAKDVVSLEFCQHCSKQATQS